MRKFPLLLALLLPMALGGCVDLSGPVLTLGATVLAKVEADPSIIPCTAEAVSTVVGQVIGKGGLKKANRQSTAAAKQLCGK